MISDSGIPSRVAHPVDQEVADVVRQGAQGEAERERHPAAQLERVLGELERDRCDQRASAEPHHEAEHPLRYLKLDAERRADQQRRRREAGPGGCGQHVGIVDGGERVAGTLAASC
jgi:hypothetical protein